ncbi:UNC93-like protein MFSD11 isoform X2 [Coccinella septempunctata]|uniref:UNC93-like protein MFSD11 isoform X1 n=1 Tax=Coccinella septempunctata TaxID=41139 RepID=UPI001D082957|nr:UNC93-like protein MFSD11 isoform X1 [Coccinella septempunctata]XP_044765203.1 UNC93-like protein MFSD11 isoform X2 [Coccinella septempunctata]
MTMDKRMFNVIGVGLAFMLTFMAFQTMGNIETTILKNVHTDDPNFTGTGYTSLAIIYAALSIFNWISPSAISVMGPKIAMLIGSITYLLFIMSFLWPNTWFLYIASAIIGAGAALIWTGQGTYLTLNSTTATISRNSGIFWAMLQCSMLFGNLFVYIKFDGQEDYIEKDVRTMVIWVLSGLAMAGVVVFFFLPNPPKSSDDAVQTEEPVPGPMEVFKEAMKLFVTPRMLMLSLAFFYSGIELGFYSGVYSTAVGATSQLTDAKKLVGLSGVFIGIGEVLGGLSFGILGKKTTKFGRDPIVIAGFVIHILAFFAIFLNLPNRSPIEDTNDEAFIASSGVLAMACSFLLGFGDACYNTQFYSIIGSIYSSNSACAFGIFKFVQSVAAAASFFYAPYVPLYGQLGILLAFAVIGTAAYLWVEFNIRNSTLSSNIKSDSESSINSTE